MIGIRVTWLSQLHTFSAMDLIRVEWGGVGVQEDSAKFARDDRWSDVRRVIETDHQRRTGLTGFTVGVRPFLLVTPRR